MFKHRKRDRSPLQVTKHGHAFWTKLTHIEKLDLCLRIIFPKFEPDPSFNLLGGALWILAILALLWICVIGPRQCDLRLASQLTGVFRITWSDDMSRDRPIRDVVSRDSDVRSRDTCVCRPGTLPPNYRVTSHIGWTKRVSDYTLYLHILYMLYVIRLHVNV